MSYYYKKPNMICFDKQELKKMFEAPHRIQILKKLAEKKVLNKTLNENELKKIANSMNMINDKEDVEMFLAIYSFSKFYQNSKICFPLRNNIKPESINSIEKLKKSIKEDDLTDFSFLTNKGLVSHQLKAYYGELSVDSFFSHIKNTLLKKYGNDIGSINIIFFLKRGGKLENKLFKKLHKKLKKLKIKGDGNILIAYNENNSFEVINTVYPILGTSRVPHNKFTGVDKKNTNSIKILHNP